MLDFIEKQHGTTPTASIIWLHGLGANGHDFEPIVDELGLPQDLGVRFIFPHAPMRPVTFNQGMVMPAWFDFTDISHQTSVDIEHVNQSCVDIAELITQEVTRGVAANRIMLAGFSQGAAIALLTGLAFHEKMAGLIGLSGFLPNDPALFQQHIHPANQHTPIFLGHGVADPLVPLSLGEGTHELLKTHDYPVTLNRYPIDHTVSLEEIADVRTWMLDILGVNA
jgi:phospholipase/carboxylesterase